MWRSWVRSLHQGIDITTAVLLLTRQMNIRSVVISSGAEFRLSLTGPILGGERSQPQNGSPGTAFVLDAIDAMTALLLILGEIQTLGIFIQAQRLSLLASDRDSVLHRGFSGCVLFLFYQT